MDVRTVRIGLAVLVVLAVSVFAAVKLLGDDDDSNVAEPVGLSQGELIDEAATLKHPAYWVGPRSGVDQYELTETQDGANVYVRYLSGGAEAGDPSANFVTVGTYLLADAAAALRRGAENSPDSVVRGNGYSLLKGANNNVYVVLDEQPDLQIEIYSPEPGEALDLARSGALAPIG